MATGASRRILDEEREKLSIGGRIVDRGALEELPYGDDYLAHRDAGAELRFTPEEHKTAGRCKRFKKGKMARNSSIRFASMQTC